MHGQIMDLFRAELRKNTLSQLQLLEEKVISDSHYQNDLLKRQREIERLSDTVVELTKKKFQLLQRLNILADSVPLSSQQEVIHRAIVLENGRHVSYFKSAQRFVGTTAEVKCQGTARIQYETCYRGEYFESFYLEVQVSGKKLKVCWHTIPDFIPLKTIIEKYNSSEIQFPVAVHLVHSYLTAFIKRRQQVIEFSTQYKEYIKEDIKFAHGYNGIILVLEIPMDEEDPIKLIVQLYYKDLKCFLPSTVKCSDTANLPASKSTIKERFMNLPIAEAFQNLFTDQTIGPG